MLFFVTVKIARLSIRIESNVALPIAWVRQRYAAFIAAGRPQARVRIDVQQRWPRRRPAYSVLPSPGPAGNGVIVRTALFDAHWDARRGIVRVQAAATLGMVDLLRLVTAFLVLRKGGILLHASAILRQKQAYVFFGPSESGKTTVARLSPDALVLTDETAALIPGRQSFDVFATPFSGEFGAAEHNTGGPLRALLLLTKARRYFLRSLGARQSLPLLMQNTFLPCADTRYFEQAIDAAAQLVRQVPCYELGFKPESTLWRFLDGRIGQSTT